MKTALLFTSAILLAFCDKHELSGEISVHDPYFRSNPGAGTGAAFFYIENGTKDDVVLVAAESPTSPKIELHTHIMSDEGVMQMREVEGGIPVPSGECVALERGGLHVMFMAIEDAPAEGDDVDLKLMFDNGEAMELVVPVDNARGGAMGEASMGEGEHNMDEAGHMGHDAEMMEKSKCHEMLHGE